MKDILMGNHKIGLGHPPFIIAEMSGNHNQSLDRALAIVDAVAKAGAHALKIQTYTAETMTLNLSHGEFFIRDKKSLWKGQSLFDLYKLAYTPWEWHKAIFERCRKKGILGFSTPFDSTAVDFLESLNVPAYKIASLEIVDIPLIKKVASTKKPIIISTGLATQAEIREAVQAVHDGGNSKLVLLKCTSAYPAPASAANLATIPDMRKRFNCQAGLSDHTLGNGVAIASVAHGAVVIEKHFTLDRSEGGVDSAFSLEPDELRELVAESKSAWQARGTISYGPTADDRASLQYRRTLYVTQDMKKGAVFTRENVRSIRPGRGLHPRYYEHVLGRPVTRNVKMGTPLALSLIGKKKKTAARG